MLLLGNRDSPLLSVFIVLDDPLNCDAGPPDGVTRGPNRVFHKLDQIGNNANDGSNIFVTGFFCFSDV